LRPSRGRESTRCLDCWAKLFREKRRWKFFQLVETLCAHPTICEFPNDHRRKKIPRHDCDRKRENQGTRIAIRLETVAGKPDVDKICTSHIERLNLSVRHFTKRFGRLGLGWSRKLSNHRCGVALFVTTHNFCKIHSTLGCTPALGARLTDHNWTIEELVHKLSETI